MCVYLCEITKYKCTNLLYHTLLNAEAQTPQFRFVTGALFNLYIMCATNPQQVGMVEYELNEQQLRPNLTTHLHCNCSHLLQFLSVFHLLIVQSKNIFFRVSVRVLQLCVCSVVYSELQSVAACVVNITSLSISCLNEFNVFIYLGEQCVTFGRVYATVWTRKIPR